MARRSAEDVRRRKDLIAAYVQTGETEPKAAKLAGVSERTHYRWKERDIEYRERMQSLQGRHEGVRPLVPDFPTFRRECFGHETYAHQQEWLKAVESSNRVLILVPPNHGKSMTFSVEYPAWRIASDRNVRGIVISKTQDMAKKSLYAIKKRLSDLSFYRSRDRNLVEEWGPFRPAPHEKALPWASGKIYVSGVDSGGKDPTIEVLGVGNQIYGSRADFIVLDDVATLGNMASEAERQKILDWISQEVVTRLEHDGKLIIIGTRVHEHDIYASFLEGGQPWLSGYTTVVQPAVINEDTHEVLCPELWPWHELEERRQEVSPRTWALVYQQQATGMPDAPFRLDALEAAKDTSYTTGQVAPDLTTVLGVDPALTGTTALVVLGVDANSRTRHIIDCRAERLLNPDNVKDAVTQMAQHYRVREVRIEKNAMQGFLSRDPDLRGRLASMSARLEEEFTSRHNKFDPEWGVSSVAAQFDAGLYRIPWGGDTQRMRGLVEELAAWRPGVRMTQDRVMALWLAELAARRWERAESVQLDPDPRVPGWAKNRGPPSWARNRYRRRLL